ncbi:hypothetical protein [Homoserinimonas hongtaonis]|uniref:Integrase n=1 Tax=Homoserinimonas hongtaonis TaxID=2079791 RepID=A0A2U1T1U6_9MICO|nr:hypothetical protein [Salinibacterium hongtaonis]PWB97820.1 hypothetical protein DF220_08235 [Salinibacterium hongtaonis]
MAEDLAPIRTLPVQGARKTLDDTVDLRDLLPNGASVLEPIRYGTDIWDFEGYPLVNQTVWRLDFTGIPPRWRTVIKDWTLLRLNPQLAESGRSGLRTDDVMAVPSAGERPLRFMSLVAYVGCFANSLTIIDRHGWTHLGPDDWGTFAAELRLAYPTSTPQTLAGYARPLTALWSVRGLLGEPDMFGGRPFGGTTVDAVFKVPQRDLNVDRPAPELCGPLLGLSLWILDHCTDDVLARLQAIADAPDLTGELRDVQVAAVTERLLAWQATGRPLPATVGLRGDSTGAVPSWATFVKLSGCSAKQLVNPLMPARRVLENIRAERGVSVYEDGFDLAITEVEDMAGNLKPWITALPATRYGLGLGHWAATLAYACTYVIATLTTIRDRELSALPHDCLVEGTYERGDVEVPVMRMRGYLVKNRMTPTAATWIVGDDVVRAVRVLHRLKELLGLRPLFHPETGREILLHPELGGVRGDKASHSLQLSGPYLGRFESSGHYLADQGFMPPLPDPPAWLAHRTIRITGIEAYANQAWGDALAAAQAHWSSRKVAEGYYGHLPSSVYIADPESVEEVRRIGTGQALIDIAIDSNAGVAPIVGNGASRLGAVLDESHVPRIATGAVTGRQLAKLGKANANVFVGEFTVCVHGPGGLCGNEQEAEFRLCRPIACRNSATTQAQRARLELRRRHLAGKTGVYERARRKIEVDAPDLEAEFAGVDDEALRVRVLRDLPGRYREAAADQEENSVE